MFWIREKIQDHYYFTGNGRCRVIRDYQNNKVVLDWYGGRCATYTYDGEWIAG